MSSDLYAKGLKTTVSLPVLLPKTLFNLYSFLKAHLCPAHKWGLNIQMHKDGTKRSISWLPILWDQRWTLRDVAVDWFEAIKPASYSQQRTELGFWHRKFGN